MLPKARLLAAASPPCCAAKAAFSCDGIAGSQRPPPPVFRHLQPGPSESELDVFSLKAS